jgi:hypothetical protein
MERDLISNTAFTVSWLGVCRGQYALAGVRGEARKKKFGVTFCLPLLPNLVFRLSFSFYNLIFAFSFCKFVLCFCKFVLCFGVSYNIKKIFV